MPNGGIFLYVAELLWTIFYSYMVKKKRQDINRKSETSTVIQVTGMEQICGGINSLMSPYYSFDCCGKTATKKIPWWLFETHNT